MRQYFQGTLDFACGVYAVINALSLTHNIPLLTARRIFAETLNDIFLYPRLKRAFLFNETDHYWIIRYCLARYAVEPPFKLDIVQPYDDSLIPTQTDKNTGSFIHKLYIEQETNPSRRRENNLKSWEALRGWLTDPEMLVRKRAALFRFHRFLPGASDPAVSHWTTGERMDGEGLHLFDASSEKNCIQKIERKDIEPRDDGSVSLYIVPASIVFLKK